MKEPVLVIMAAGMGSRYGGLKQIDPVDPQGDKILDFSIYDALRAGFKKAIFIIKKENEQLFKECIGDAVARHMEVEYVFQDLNDVPEFFTIPDGRTKPWGTAHAIYSCRNVIDSPFAVINADDYYGVEAFKVLYDYLVSTEDDGKYRFAMVGYLLGNTLTENGSVSRGCCEMDDQGFLTSVTERTKIIKTEDGAAYSEDDGASFTPISPDSLVSMNFFGFTPDFFNYSEKGLVEFLKGPAQTNIKAEFFIPLMVNQSINDGTAKLKVLSSDASWFGVTYKEDKPDVMRKIVELIEKGVYPRQLW